MNYKDEYKFAVHLPRSDDREDTHVIKVVRHHSDGRREHLLKTEINYKRPFWVTKKVYRNHKQSKECESIDKLKECYSTQSDLANEIFREEGMRKFKHMSLWDVYKAPFAPYVYGASVPSDIFIAIDHKDTCDIDSPYLVGILDIENDVDTNEITMISFTRVNYDSEIRTTVFVSDVYTVIREEDLRERVLTTLAKSLPDKIGNINTKDVKIEVFKRSNQVALIKSVFEIIHHTDIDVLTGWNFLYDMKMMTNALIDAGIEPRKIFADPDLPDNMRYYDVKEAAPTRTTQTGDVVNVPFEMRWHIFTVTAKFYMLDHMAAFVHLRSQDTKLHGGFGLDNVLKKTIGFGKLKLDNEKYESLSSEDWHRVVSKEKPVDYVAYNIYDTLGESILDIATSDLSISIPLLCGLSDLNTFKSGPAIIYNDFYKFYKDLGFIVGNIRNIDKPPRSLGRTDWVVTVNLWKSDDTFATNIALEDTGTDGVDTYTNVLRNRGYHIPNNILKSKVFTYTLDLDKEAAYPTGTSVLNISNETVAYELLYVENIDRSIFMRANISLISGLVSAHNYCVDIHNIKPMIELDTFIKEELK